MTKQVIRVPTVLNDGAHRPVQEAVRRVNANFTELYDRAVSVKDFGAVGDGVTDDSSKIFDAISSGGPIFIPDGTFRCDTLGNYSITNSVHLYGPGTFDGNDTATSYLKIAGSIDHFIIDGPRFVGMRAGCQVSSQSYEVNDIDIKNTFMSSGETGWEFNCKYKTASFSNNNIDGLTSSSGVSGFWVGNNNAFSEEQQNARVWGNTIRNLTKTSAGGETHAILVYGDWAKIWGNHVEEIKNSSDGVGAEGIYTKAIDGAVYGNTLINAGTYQGSIALKGQGIGSKRMECFGNVLTSTTGAYDAIYLECQQAHVHGNHIEGFGRYAVVSGTFTLEGVNVSGNTIANHRGEYGMLFQHAGRVFRCDFNLFDGIANSQISQTSSSGIYVANFSAGNLSQISLCGNQFRVPTNAATSTFYAIQVRINTGNTTERLSILDNVSDVAAATTLKYDLNVHASGTIEKAHLRGSQGKGITGTIIYTSPANITEFLVEWAGAGTPEANAKGYAGPGSTWKRTDGGASTSLYVKESAGSANTGWVAK
jgi:hypothetical protein